MAKGSAFEREISKRLSKWWTQNENPPRDDIFWRSQTSGGRATQRMKSGKTTFGSYGDIAAVDPMGQRLLRFWTIELKRGRSHGSPWELIESSGNGCNFRDTLLQVIRSQRHAGSQGWLLISKKDRQPIVAYVDMATARLIRHAIRGNYVRYCVALALGKGKPPLTVRFVGLPLDILLRFLSPGDIPE